MKGVCRILNIILVPETPYLVPLQYFTTLCRFTQNLTYEKYALILNYTALYFHCIMQMNNGTIRKFSNLKLVTGIFRYPYLLADGKIRIRAGEIKAYQDQKCYAISQSGFVSGHRTCVAKETLPGFAVRIAKGKINVFVKKYFNGITTVDEYFVQQGDEGEILAYTSETMNRMIENDPDALDFFLNKKYNTPKTNRSHQPMLYGRQRSAVSYQLPAQSSARVN